MESMHKYEVRGRATQVRSGVLAGNAVPTPIWFSAPREFGGDGGAWTPEHLFLSAVVSCFVSTFSGMAELSKFSFTSFEVDAEATLQKDAGGWKFTEIRLSPLLKIACEADRKRGARLLEKAGRTCPIARSISATVHLAAEIRIVPEIALAERAQP
jgi:peroxiredoxin-like protein